MDAEATIREVETARPTAATPVRDARAGTDKDERIAWLHLVQRGLQRLRQKVRGRDARQHVFGVALFASVVPAVRALRVDPMVALRAE